MCKHFSLFKMIRHPLNYIIRKGSVVSSTQILTLCSSRTFWTTFSYFGSLPENQLRFVQTHWGQKTYICVSKLTIIGSDNGLSPEQRQAIFWTDIRIHLMGPLRTNFNETLFEIYIFSFPKMNLKSSSAKWRPFCLGLNVLKRILNLGIIHRIIMHAYIYH